MSVCIVVVTREHLSLRAEHREHAPLAVSRGYHIPGKVVGIPLRGAVRFHHAGDASPLVQQIFRPVAVAVHDAGDPAPGVVLQLLAGPAHALHAPLGPGEVILILHTAAHAVYPLEQAARPVVGVALEHMAVRADHRKYPSLGVIGELEAVAAVRFRVVLVGTDQPHHLAVPVVDGALYPAVPLYAPDLPVQQVIGYAGLATLVVHDLGQIARRIVAELRPVVNAAGRLPVGLRNQAVGRRASSVIKLKLPYLSI